ncbi:MAG: DNA topoisomerase, partial [Lachnospiraceae bacterium]|nr:DNA topoisomerase [Lachnospiraceae bacterium]
ATMLSGGDELLCVCPMTEQKQVVLQTKGGIFLRFNIDEVPQKKKAAVGVRGMKLAAHDEVEYVHFLTDGVDSTIEYKGRKVELSRLKIAKRDTKGSKLR